MIDVLIQLLIICIIIGVAWWILDYVPVPDPLNRIAKVVIIVIGLIIIIGLLLGIGGGNLGNLKL
jgi:nucleoside recognition membrane protein YjiH